MDGCSTMSGEHNGVRSLFERSTNHFTYIHCRNHCLALCFAHLIPQFEDFKKFDGLLLNLYLLLKNRSVKQAIFDEVQKAYELTSLKLIKAAVMRWLSHGKAAQRVLDRFKTLVAALDEIYLRKSEPAVRGLRDDLVKPKTIVTLCFLADILKSTNILQTVLQDARLNFLQIPQSHEKSENPKEPKGCYFGRLQEFLDIAARSAGGRYNTRSYEEFEVTSFEINTIHLFLQALVKEITEAFNIPDQLKGFTSIDTVSIPTKSEEIEHFGKEPISSFASFYREARLINEVVVPSIINKEALQIQYQAFKLFVIKDRMNMSINSNLHLLKLSNSYNRQNVSGKR